MSGVSEKVSTNLGVSRVEDFGDPLDILHSAMPNPR